jgi:hypothetical protein
LRLLTNDGVEMLDSDLLWDHCPYEDGVEHHLLLVVAKKSEQELDWEKRWAEVTPAWLVQGSKDVLHQADFVKMKQDAFQAESVCKTGTPVCVYHQSLCRSCSCMHRPSPCMPRRSEKEDKEQDPRIVASGKDLVKRAKGLRGNFEVGTTYEKHGDVALLVPDAHGFRIARYLTSKAVLSEAVKLDPELFVPRIQALNVCGDVATIPGMYSLLPEQFRRSRYILDEALEADEELREEFERTATKSEVRRWHWRRQEDAGVQRRRRKF